VKIIIDPASPDFPFEQLAAGLRTMITTGKITGRMPPMAEGLIRTVKGRGTFVVDR
jgi:hypothetical protein